MANLLLWPGVTDLTGSFRLYKKAVIEDLIKSVKGKTYVFQMEVGTCSHIGLGVCSHIGLGVCSHIGLGVL
jgi:hypothetical protein